MNEIDPSNSNGRLISENHQQEATSSSNKSPLLSSLLTSAKHDSVTNGQQNKASIHNKNDHGIMSTPKLVSNSQYDEENAFMTRKSLSQSIEASPNELDLTSASANCHRKYSNLNEILHRNNNNNKVNVTSEPSAKSILENCLLNPSPQKSQSRLESHSKMEESEFHHHIGSPSTSSMLKYSEDSRKVEPLKINLNREPIRTVIKLPQSHSHDSSNKTVNRTQNQITIDRSSTITISPTLSSSSSLSSESSFENSENSNNQRPSSIQVIPKLHIRNLLDVSLNHEQSELHIVPKLTITGLNSPQSVLNNCDQKEHCVNSVAESSPAIPKLTIKKDNNTSDYHLNDANSIPKLHIKTNHVHQAKDGGMKLTFKSVSEPSVPKLTIKTKTDNDDMMVVSNDETIKSKNSTKSSVQTKTLIKSAAQEDSIPKLTLKAVNNSITAPTFEKVVPKLVVKLPKDSTEVESSSCSSTPSPPPSHVPKLSIKPILPPEKEVPIQEKHSTVQTASPQNADMKFSINRLIGFGSSELSAVEKPLEINTSSIMKNADSGQDSPRIILKINKTNSESITTELIQQSMVDEISSKITAPNKKRIHSNDNGEEFTKKLKLCEEEDVILINDSDASSNDAVNKNNHKTAEKVESLKDNSPNNEVKAVAGSRSLRLSRRNATPLAAEADSLKTGKEDLQASREIDPLALSNDATTNSVEELITPKRGRGRPKKIVEKPQPTIVVEEESTDPLETQVQELSESVNEEGVELKKTSSRGRGRGRGRSKKTVEFIKNGKPIQITLEGHDDDDSPSFSLYNRSLRGGFGTGRKTRGGKSLRGRHSKSSPFLTPERSKENSFTSPTDHSNRRKLFNTPSIFEEDTRMSIGCESSQQNILRPSETQSCEESQSSLLSNTSNTVDGSMKKRQKKMEVGEPEGRTEFTIDLLAEYDWPQNEPGRNRDTFMIQEQIAEYLGVKSFKRKYPDLVRRPVEMEERNFLFENGFASEKMCDLGLTAVYASEVLDIMCNDYPEKYEEYKRYQREKAFRFARMRLETAVVDRSQMQKDKAITSASDFNTRFNKDRRENRKSCMDLQNFLIQKPTPIRDYNYTAAATHQSHYPVALVPGQFSEYYEKYTPLQLACYPINTVLVDHKKLEEYLLVHPKAGESSDDCSSESDDDGSSSSDSELSESESSSDEEYGDPECKVCLKTPFVNKFGKPEKFITCSTCKNQAHPSCIEMSDRMYKRTFAYKWQCSSCKTCNKCRKAKDNKMLYCVQCDRGFHIYCLGLRNVPEGQYHCDNCNVCSACGAKSPEGHFNGSLTQQQRQELAMIAQWNHEFTVNCLTNIREHTASLCLPCFRKDKNSMTVE